MPISTNIQKNVISIPEATATKNITVRKRTPYLLSIFLFGVIASKWCVNHRRKRLRVHLPASKKYVADLLGREFGGTVHVARNNAGVTWQITSDDSLLRLKKVAQKVKSGLPPEFYKQLTAFIAVYV